jgi:LysM repeat protein
MFRKSYLFIPVIIISLTSCRASRYAATVPGTDPDVQSFISKFGDLAVSEMKRTGIPASITLAQGMVESDFGRSSLARDGNNYFGIKCHDDWTGPILRHDDETRNECFRKYSRPEDSFRDHSDFLRNVPRYKELFEYPPTDYRGWAIGLKKTGYATNPDYANMLIRKIEENKLYYYDNGNAGRIKPALASPSMKPDNSGTVMVYGANTTLSGTGNMAISERVSRIMENNRIKYIIAREGETLETIDNEFQLLKWELPRYNDLESNFKPVAGQVLYLQPKRDKAEIGKDTHTVESGDTMYSISQSYGVKLNKLYEYNRMGSGQEPSAGEKIWLRSMKPVN